MTVIVQERTARTEHECTFCQGMILPGQRYTRHAATPNDVELGNRRWWVLTAHADREQCAP